MKSCNVVERMVIGRINFFIINMFYMLLFVDCINGYFLEKGIVLPISQFFKITLFFLMAFEMILVNRGKLILWGISFYSTFIIFFFSFSVGFLYSLTFTHLFKFLLLVCSFFYLKNFISDNPQLKYGQLMKILKINSYVLIVNILLVLIGLGNSSYGEDIGSKGYFYAPNELSGLFAILCPCMLFYVGRKYSLSSFKYCFILGVFLVSVFLLGTKSSIISCTISIFFISGLLVKSKRNYIRLYLLGFVIAFVIIFIGYLFLDSFGFWDRWAFFYDKGGLQLLLLSGREEYWVEEKSELLDGGIGNIIMGLGEARTVEMDMFDAFLNYGIVGLIVVYSFFFFLLYKAYHYRLINSWARVIFFIDVMLLIASSLSGHIIFSGMAGPFIALVNVLVLIPNKYIA